ncbi:MAG TPA: hypothetical protein VF820_00950 [Patescibacteria group bacterium]
MPTSIPQSKLLRFFFKLFSKKHKGLAKKKQKFSLGKRHKFAIGIGILSIGLFFAEYALNAYGVVIAFFLAVLSDVVLFWAVQQDLEDNFASQIFILPFLYSLSFGLFAFLTPARLITKIILTTLYAVGLYSVFLSENIFTVASIRTIALLNSARIVSLVISLITYFFLASTTFSFRISVIPTMIILFVFTLLLSMHAVWTYTLEREFKKDLLWVSILSVCIFELALVLWFWPTSPTVGALFLTSVWYVLVGLSHVWLDKRLFRSVLWEYIWVAVIAFLVLVAFTKWQ